MGVRNNGHERLQAVPDPRDRRHPVFADADPSIIRFASPF
jgi:hypothetical protein